jgi:hypothetical protein
MVPTEAEMRGSGIVLDIMFSAEHNRAVQQLSAIIDRQRKPNIVLTGAG